MIEIPTPSEKEVIKYLKKWDSLENYVLQESALDKLFFKTYPNNNDINDILIKASSLNDFYSTNIFSIFKSEYDDIYIYEFNSSYCVFETVGAFCLVSSYLVVVLVIPVVDVILLDGVTALWYI